MSASTKKKYTSYRTIQDDFSLKISLHTFGERLFSMMTPEYERYLMEEIYGLRCVVKFTLDEIMDMPVADRRLFIQLHNQRIERENSSLKSNDTTKDNIDDVKKMVQNRKEKK
jgi:hypothetical protein